MTLRHTTTFRVLKDRFTGQSIGEVFYLGYDTMTGRLFPTDLKTENVDWDDNDEPSVTKEGGGDEF